MATSAPPKNSQSWLSQRRGAVKYSFVSSSASLIENESAKLPPGQNNSAAISAADRRAAA
jgi:hypothetical protein